MPKFRKRPVVIDAEQFWAPNFCSDPAHQMFMQYPIQRDEKGAFLVIPTLEGNHRADEGDWIITGVAGEQYPCKDSIFKLTYESA